MTTFARVTDGFVTDVRVHASAEELTACFHPDWLASHPFIVVPDGTLHGAREDGNGGYIPPQAPPPSQPRLLSKTAFQDHAVSRLGGSTTGMVRFTEIMDATRDSASGAVRFAFARYEAAQTFEKANTETLTSLMVGAGVMTDAERAAILDNWPNQ